MDNKYRRILDIPYIELHFILEMQEDCVLSANKASALRGGMGQMLLRSSCVQDRECEKCIFSEECLVQRIMYSPFDIKPPFVTKGESIGFHLECENYQREFSAGDSLEFQLTLFGKTIVYFYQILQAFYMLGQEGLGEGRARYLVSGVTNTNREVIVDGTMIYMFDCFAGIEADQMDLTGRIPAMAGQKSWPSKVRRHSTTHDRDIVLRGIKGYLDFEEIEPDLRRLLYAGEILHIGKNTRFGFGRYTMVEA